MKKITLLFPTLIFSIFSIALISCEEAEPIQKRTILGEWVLDTDEIEIYKNGVLSSSEVIPYERTDSNFHILNFQENIIEYQEVVYDTVGRYKLDNGKVYYRIEGAEIVTSPRPFKEGAATERLQYELTIESLSISTEQTYTRNDTVIREVEKVNMIRETFNENL